MSASSEAVGGKCHMKREQSGPFLSAVFVDYDNIYMSLKRKSEDAAKRFAKDAPGWLKQIETGALITPTNGIQPDGVRRIVMNRCYGNPVPRRNASDNSTDMSSFPFVRHHFLRAGFEVVDCPPLTAQLKNSSDIRMVMDLRDYLDHSTRFDEFVILSGDADFTPVLHRLRAHARRTVIYATDYTAAPYTAISDGEVREADLIQLLIQGQHTTSEQPAEAPTSHGGRDATRRAIIEDVVTRVRAANAPVPLEVLADHAVRSIGHDRTIGTGWAGAGGFRELLTQELPQGFRLSGEPPYVVIDIARHIPHQPAIPVPTLKANAASSLTDHAEPHIEPRLDRQPIAERDRERMPEISMGEAYGRSAGQTPGQSVGQRSQGLGGGLGLNAMTTPLVPQQAATAAPRRPAVEAPPATTTSSDGGLLKPEQPSPISQSIARIHEACKAPPLAPPEYRALFEIIAQEITENGLIGAQTIQNIAKRAQDRGIDVRRDDVRFVLEVVSEADPWFEQGASANLFAGRFRNFVVARCRAQGLTLSADELDLVEAWFAGNGLPQQPAQRQAPPQQSTFAAVPPPRAALAGDAGYWPDDARTQASDQRQRTASLAQDGADLAIDDFPRIVRTRLRG